MQGTEFTYISIWEITGKILRSVTGWMKTLQRVMKTDKIL